MGIGTSVRGIGGPRIPQTPSRRGDRVQGGRRRPHGTNDGGGAGGAEKGPGSRHLPDPSGSLPHQGERLRLAEAAGGQAIQVYTGTDEPPGVVTAVPGCGVSPRGASLVDECADSAPG